MLGDRVVDDIKNVKAPICEDDKESVSTWSEMTPPLVDDDSYFARIDEAYEDYSSDESPHVKKRRLCTCFQGEIEEAVARVVVRFLRERGLITKIEQALLARGSVQSVCV